MPEWYVIALVIWALLQVAGQRPAKDTPEQALGRALIADREKRERDRWKR